MTTITIIDTVCHTSRYTDTIAYCLSVTLYRYSILVIYSILYILSYIHSISVVHLGDHTVILFHTNVVFQQICINN